MVTRSDQTTATSAGAIVRAMSAAQHPDVIIIGTGQAGVPLATRLAAAGKTVLIAEKGNPGGTCVNVGCTPTKTLVASARAAHVARTAGRFGVRTGAVAVDFSAVMARKNEIVARWRAGVEKRLAGAGERLRLLRGHARFVGPRAIEVNGERYQAEQIVLNVGARPALPDIPGLSDVPYLDSAALLDLKALPERLLILGAGYIACEMGQMFRRFGSEVSLCAPSARLLPRETPAVSEALAGVFEAEGIQLALGKHVTRAARTKGGIELQLSNGEGAPLTGSELLVATGRTPNTHDLGCDAGQIELDANGYVRVDERYQTSQAGVFAVGDCVPGPQFTHVSWDDHRVLFDILMGRAARVRSERLVPYTVFTDPQVAGVGLSAPAARAQGLEVEVASMPFGNIARAIETDETAGIVELVLDARSERILGASVVGVDAGELIHVFSVLMQAKATARAIVDAEFVHPTFAEGLQTAVMQLPRYALSH
jgi:pyruvate/2-oxoglutarate dehydrogenase complex dihydrolipoamide dehydrogenase (E3) component